MLCMFLRSFSYCSNRNVSSESFIQNETEGFGMSFKKNIYIYTPFLQLNCNPLQIWSNVLFNSMHLLIFFWLSCLAHAKIAVNLLSVFQCKGHWMHSKYETKFSRKYNSIYFIWNHWRASILFVFSFSHIVNVETAVMLR